MIAGRGQDAILRALKRMGRPALSPASMYPRGYEHLLQKKPGADTRQSAVLLALVPTSDSRSVTNGNAVTGAQGVSGLELPLIVRSRDGGPHSGQVALPGGATSTQDHSIEQTALREAQEEINLPTHAVEVVTSLPRLYVPVSNFEITPVVGYCGIEDIWSTLKPNPDEVASIVRASVGDMHRTWRERTVDARGQSLIAWSYRVGEHTIWGATAAILRPVIEALVGPHSGNSSR